MGKEELLIMLYDYYGELFSIQQREYFEWYYFDSMHVPDISNVLWRSALFASGIPSSGVVFGRVE